MVSFYEWSFFSIKLSYQIVHWNADSADQIPKKRCLLFKWEEWKKQSKKYETKKHEKISFTEWINSVIPFFYPDAALKALPIESCTNWPNSAEYLRKRTGQPYHHPVISFLPLVDMAWYSCIQLAVNRYFIDHLLCREFWADWDNGKPSNILCHWFQWDCPYWFLLIVIIPLKQKKTCPRWTDAVFSKLNEDPV